MTISIYDFPDQLDEVRELLAVVKAIDKAPNRSRSAVCKMFADPTREGWSWKNLDTTWRRWVKAGRNEVILVDRRLHTCLQKGKPGLGLPDDFLQWAGGQMLGNQRKSRPAWRGIIRRWKAWLGGDAQAAIPGYDFPPPPDDKGKHPEGWSYENLMRQAQPPAEELAIARIGTVAAGPYLPHIHGTREGVRFLEWIFFDDVVHDREIVLRGHLEPMRLLQLGGLDYASAVYLKFGLRPDVVKADGTRDRLKRRDFLFLVAHLLLEYGWPADYVMHLVVERGTATMTLAEAQFLYDISDGRVQVGYTSMEGRFVLAWQEAKSGNSKGKAPIESWHNLFHNEQAALAGQVGKDRDHSPAALPGSDKEAVSLNKAALLLTPEKRRALRMPYPGFAAAHAESLEIVQRINRRRDHEMEGFEQVLDWRVRGLPMDWQPEAALAALDPALRSRVEYLPRVETPLERMQRLSLGERFIKPHPGALVRFYEDSHTATRIERREASVKIENKTYWFGPTDPLDALPNGTEVILHHAPLDPAFALVTSEGKFIGVWPRQIVRRNDADTLAKGIQRKQSFLNHSVSAVRGKMLEKLVEQDRRLSENIDTLEEGGILPSEADHALSTSEQAPCTDIAEAMQKATETLSTESTKARSRASTARDAAESLRRRAARLRAQDDSL